MTRLLLLLCLSSLLTTCAVDDLSKDVPDLADDGSSFFEPKESTIWLDENTNLDIISYDTSGLIVYGLGSPQLDSIEVGSIILSDPNEAAAGGFLERVTDVKIEGDRMVLRTEPANLPDAFKRYRINILGNVRGINQGRGDDDPGDVVVGPVCFNLDSQRIQYAVEIPIENNEDWVFEWKVAMSYDLTIAHLVEFDGTLKRFELGVDKLDVKNLTISGSFKYAGNQVGPPPYFSPGLVRPEVLLDLPIPLGTFPVAPGLTVSGTLNLDLRTEYKYEGTAGITATLQTVGNTQLKYVTGSEIPEANRGVVGQAPGYTATAGLSVNGQFRGTIAVGISIGLAPYTRQLFSSGIGASFGPQIQLKAAVPISPFNPAAGIPASFQGGLSLDARIFAFFDANFFGLFENRFDQNLVLLRKLYPLYGPYGVDYTCGRFFHTVFQETICDGVNTNLVYTITPDPDAPGQTDLSGNLDIYLDNQLIAENQPTSGTVALSGSLAEGDHTIRYVRKGHQSLLFCEEKTVVLIRDCSTDPFNCVGETIPEPSRDDYYYCIRQFPDGSEWMTNNLNAALRDGSDPGCYGDIEDNCNIFGGLYSYYDLFGVELNTSPTEVNADGEPVGLCPAGFHVPSVQEWLSLLGETDQNPDQFGLYWIEDPKVNNYLANRFWPSNMQPGATANGFNITPSGFYNYSSHSGYTGLQETVYYWTSTPSPGVTVSGEEVANGNYVVIVSEDQPGRIGLLPAVPTVDIACRCIKD